MQPTLKSLVPGTWYEWVQRYDIFSLVILSMPFDDLSGKSVNTYDFFERPVGASTVTPTESDCSSKVNLTLHTESCKN